MKTYAHRNLAVLQLICLAAILVSALAACGSGTSKPNLVGTWTEISATSNPNPSGGCHIFKNGTLTCKTNGSSAVTGTWKQLDAHHLRLGVGSLHARITYSLHGNRLTLIYPKKFSTGTEVLVRH